MYVTDISQWEEIGRAHGEFFRNILPTTTMVEVSRLINPEHLVEIEVEADPHRARPADIPYLVGSAKKIHQELGWAPKHDLQETLRDLLEYWRDQVHSVRATGGRV